MLASRSGMDAHTCDAAAQAWAGFGLAELDPLLEIASIRQTMLVFVCCQQVKKPMCSLFLRGPKNSSDEPVYVPSAGGLADMPMCLIQGPGSLFATCDRYIVRTELGPSATVYL